MADLSDAEIMALAKAAGVPMPAELLTEVGYSLNGMLETLNNIEVAGVDTVEPLPIIIPPIQQSGE